MTNRLRLVFEGPIESDHRPRVGRRGTFMPPKYVAAKVRMRSLALASRPEGWRTDGRFRVELQVYEQDARSRDLDNCAKGPIDAMCGVLFNDDRQVDLLLVYRDELDRKRPRVEVEVWRLPDKVPAPKRTRAKSPPSARDAALALERDLLSQPSMTTADRRKLVAARVVVDSEPSRKVAAARQYVGVADAGLTPTQVSRALGLPDAHASKRRTT